MSLGTRSTAATRRCSDSVGSVAQEADGAVTKPSHDIPQRLGETDAFAAELERLIELAPEPFKAQLLAIARGEDQPSE